jgi:hypothetical protein
MRRPRSRPTRNRDAADWRTVFLQHILDLTSVPVKREPEHIANLFSNIIAVAIYTANLAAMLIEMHDNGVEL